MECSLTYENSEKSQRNGVLILILMEYSQTVAKGHIWRTYGSLNPYSNGILTDKYFELTIGGTLVLILILMEYSLTNVMKCKLSKELSS